jgi:hypothetical protein
VVSDEVCTTLLETHGNLTMECDIVYIVVIGVWCRCGDRCGDYCCYCSTCRASGDSRGNKLRVVAAGKIVTAVIAERVLVLRCIDSRRERTYAKMKQRNGGGRASKVVCCKCDK